MGWVDAELGLVALAAMLSPTTLSFSVLALVLGDRPLRTGFWFYLGALTATLAHPGGFVLTAARGWLERHVRSIAALLLLAIAAALLRNGIAGLTD